MPKRSFGRVVLPLVGLLVACSGSEGTLTISGSATSTTGALERKNISPLLAFTGSPTSFKVTLYRIYIAEAADCSDPILIQDFGETGTEFDLFEDPTIVEASVAEGTYHCMIMETNDVMKFKADDVAVTANTGCQDTTTEYSFDIYRDGEPDDGLWIDIDGAAIEATGSAASPGSDRVFYFSSTSASSIEAAGSSVNDHQKGTLASDLVVPGQTTFYVDATNSVTNHNDGSNDYCWVEQLLTGFR